MSEAKTVAEFLFSQHQAKLANHVLPVKQTVAEYKIVSKNEASRGFIPRVGALCPQCGKHQLIRKSVTRKDNTETDFLACAGYPNECKTMFALVALANIVDIPEKSVVGTHQHTEHATCPRCKNGTLVMRKAKTEFLGCSQYPKCKFTSYCD